MDILEKYLLIMITSAVIRLGDAAPVLPISHYKVPSPSIEYDVNGRKVSKQKINKCVARPPFVPYNNTTTERNLRLSASWREAAAMRAHSVSEQVHLQMSSSAARRQKRDDEDAQQTEKAASASDETRGTETSEEERLSAEENVLFSSIIFNETAYGNHSDDTMFPDEQETAAFREQSPFSYIASVDPFKNLTSLFSDDESESRDDAAFDNSTEDKEFTFSPRGNERDEIEERFFRGYDDEDAPSTQQKSEEATSSQRPWRLLGYFSTDSSGARLVDDAPPRDDALEERLVFDDDPFPQKRSSRSAANTPAVVSWMVMALCASLR